MWSGRNLEGKGSLIYKTCLFDTKTFSPVAAWETPTHPSNRGSDVPFLEAFPSLPGLGSSFPS